MTCFEHLIHFVFVQSVLQYSSPLSFLLFSCPKFLKDEKSIIWTQFRAAGPYEDTRTGPNQVLRPNKVARTGPNQVLRPKEDLKIDLN